MPDRTETDKLPPLAGLAEAAELLGVHKTNVRKLAGLPEPRDLEAGPVWARVDIEQLAARRAT